MSTRKGLVWVYSGQICGFFIQFCGSIFIARVLSPSELGVFAIAMAALGTASIFTTFGVGSFIVREHTLSPKTLDTAYTLNSLLTVGLSLVLYILSFSAELVLGDARAKGVLQIIAFSNLFSVFSFRPLTMFQREMQFKLISILSLISSSSQTILTVIFAFLGASYMSPAYASFFSGLLSIPPALYLGRMHVGYRLSLSGSQRMIRFGFQILLVNGVAIFCGKLSDLILGRLQGVAALGLYSRAGNLSGLVFNNLYGSATRVVFVQLSKDMRETGDLRPTFVRALHMIVSLMWPLLIGLAILAKPFVVNIYGLQWEKAALPLSLLLIAQVLGLGFGMNWELFALREEMGLQAKYEVVRSSVGLVLFAAGSSMNMALAAGSRVVDSALGLYLYSPHVKRLARTAPNELRDIYIDCGVLSFAACTPVFIVMCYFKWSSSAPVPILISAVLLGVFFWTVRLVSRDNPLWQEACRIFISWQKT